MNPAQVSLVLVLKCYQTFISPLKSTVLGPFARCRYSPTCSQYAQEAVRAYGAGKGSYFALKRVCRCHPWGGFGFDPLPAPSNHS